MNNPEFELVKLGDWWRFVSHKHKMLTVGWKYKDKADFSIIRFDSYTEAEMYERYQDYFSF